jgi:GT2 family glycosyltransferase
MLKSVFTIIVTYNGMKWIERCLRSIHNQSHVIIVDNNSTDGTVEFIESNFSDIILLKQNVNLGFGKANNIGMKYALKNNANAVFLINQDVYADKNCISKLLSISKSNPEYGIISPIHMSSKGKEMDRYFSFCAHKNELFKVEKTDNDSILYDVPMVNGAAWFVPINTINIVGGFDPIFYHYGEDHNYCQRILFHHLKIGIASNIFIRHDRESRVKKEVILFSEAYFKKYGNQMNINHADINIEYFDSIRLKQKNKYLKNILKAVISFNYKNVFGYIKQYKLIDPIFTEIVNSRQVTKIQGPQYIVE